MTPSPLEQAVLSFVQLRTGGDGPVSLDTLIFDELQIDGLDAYTFMEDFMNEFDVDMSGYDPERYAMSEADLANIFKTLWRAVFNRRALVKFSFPVRHLLAVAQQGQWCDYHKASSTTPAAT
ncbi:MULTISPECIES: DUF1493 family protein [Hymenobacter]|uniref:DUF1493 family protein n=2 Tax=Hymenobacter TaxID=89966 RepID=A0A7Y7U6C1_9BACT|nr:MULTISPECIES: DUF1493 family protein [Hymenobacter]NVO32353.1 DUF1493 family protein [Hymenobacter lapidiphilus]NVO33118.1 DUF1493 family protein [Hymenobacter lapidiphilus]OWP61519.1 hypothetical protein CDA63_18965 [Hymenobacter amundsenii]